MNKFFRIFLSIVLTLSVVLGCIGVSAYDIPQKYSSEPYTDEISFAEEVKNITLPVYHEQIGIEVWLNKSRVQLSSDAVLKSGTVYVPLASFFAAAGFEVTGEGTSISVKNSMSSAEFKVNSSECTVNGISLNIKNGPVFIGNVLMASSDMIAAVLNAKVWFDEDGQTLAVTTGEMKDDGILRNINGKLYMNGEPYYEISFNKWDLAYQIAGGGEWYLEQCQYSAAEEALQMLHENGFKSIRVFTANQYRSAYVRSSKARETFYEYMDMMFDLADKYEIKINVCMALPDSCFCDKNEDYFDLICNPNSVSRQNLYDYIDTFVTRYKDRKSVLMWEIVNEGNLQCDIGWTTRQNQYSAKQLGIFYAECAQRIKMNDPERLVTGGDGELRGAQFNLYKGVKIGQIGSNWTQDTLEERLKVLYLINYGLDVISAHAYDYGLNEIYYAESRENTETTRHQDIDLYKDEAERLGKIFYNGETSLSCTSVDDDSQFEKAELDAYLQRTIDVGVQLTHWWTFHCDRLGHDAEDNYTWDMTYGKGLEAIKEANQKLQEKYCVNAIKVTDVSVIWPDVHTNPVLDAVKENTELKITNPLIPTIIIVASAVVVVAAAVVVVIAVAKKKGKKA